MEKGFSFPKNCQFIINVEIFLEAFWLLECKSRILEYKSTWITDNIRVFFCQGPKVRGLSNRRVDLSSLIGDMSRVQIRDDQSRKPPMKVLKSEAMNFRASPEKHPSHITVTNHQFAMKIHRITKLTCFCFVLNLRAKNLRDIYAYLWWMNLAWLRAGKIIVNINQQATQNRI